MAFIPILPDAFSGDRSRNNLTLLQQWNDLRMPASYSYTDLVLIKRKDDKTNHERTRQLSPHPIATKFTRKYFIDLWKLKVLSEPAASHAASHDH